MGELPVIGMLWMRGSLSFLEQLCIRSFQDAGHSVVLYSYEDIGYVPDGVERRDASLILPERSDIVHTKSGSPAPHADRFRYLLLAQERGMIWADTDAYCLKPFTTETGHFYGWESDSEVNIGVLGLPPESETLARLIDFTSDEFAIPHFLKPSYVAELEAARDRGEPVHVGDQVWAVWGPKAFTHFLKETGEIRHALPREVLYPYTFRDRRRMLFPGRDHSEAITEATRSIHLYGRRMRARVAERDAGFPHPGSLLGQLLIKHGIDPMEAPLKGCPDPDPNHPHAGAYRPGGAARTEVGEVRPLDDVVVVTTMKNEGAFILDWVAYHLSIGVTHFVVYTNDCSDVTDDILDRLAEMELVTRIDNPVRPGERPQRVALEMAQSHPRVVGADAYVCMDVDEYIDIHVGDGTLTALFAAAGDPDLLSMTWRFFGSNGIERYDDRPVPEQFTTAAPAFVRKPHQNWGFKTFVRRGAPFAKIGVHRPLEPTGPMPRWSDGCGRQMPESYRDSGWRSNIDCWGYDFVTLNHYATRSKDSFLVKRDRGRTNHINRDQGAEYWALHDRNDEENRSILTRLPMMDLWRARFAADPVLAALHRAAVRWHERKAAALRGSGGLRTVSDTPLPERTVVEPSPQPAILQGTAATEAYEALQRRAERLDRLSPLDAPLPRRRITLVTSMRNEAPYILEWIAYHRSIGVTDFLIYHNDCADQTVQILKTLADAGFVTVVSNPYKPDKGQRPQRGALNHAVGHPLVVEADWYSVIDVDEFINVHVGDGTLSALFEASDEPNVLSMTWKFFGNDSIAEVDNRWITETFVRSAPTFIPKPRLGWGFKSLVHRTAPFSKLGVHRPLDLDPARRDAVRWVNGSGRVMPDDLIDGDGWRSTKRTVGYDLVTLNHYVLRSAEGYLVKRERGRINHVDEDQGWTYWQRRNYTSELDDSIVSRLPRARSEYECLLEIPGLSELQAQAVAWHRARAQSLRSQADYSDLFEKITAADQTDALYIAKAAPQPA